MNQPSIFFVNGDSAAQFAQHADIAVVQVSRQEIEKGAVGDLVDRLMVFTDDAALATKFMGSELPMEKQTSRLERGVEWLASQRWLTFVLFLVGMICLSAEVNSPGLGVPGLISLVCFLFFFWIVGAERIYKE